MSGISALRKLRQEELEFQNSLGNTASWRPAWATWQESILKTK
jgi:hypothetical protein